MLFFALVFGIIALYCLLAIFLKLPTFKAAKAFRKISRNNKNVGTFKILMADCSKALSKHIPMGMLKQIEMQKLLDAAGMKETPKEYMAQVVLYSLLVLAFAIPAYLLHPLLALIPAAFAVYVFIRKYNKLTKMGDKRKHEIEKELPRFVSYMAHTLKSTRNVLDCIDIYRANYNSPLTEELAVTTADMRTGNAELALQRMETRINSPFMSELVRGLLSAMRGDDMTTYFDNLSNKLSNVWEQRLKLQALKKEPKIMRMSFLVFGCAAITIFIVMAAALKSASTIFGGMR